MTIPATVFRNDYTGAGTTATYAYGFKIRSNTWLKATVRNVATGGETTLTLTTDYTVTGVNVATGGNIVLVDDGQDWIDENGYLATGWKLSIRIYVDIKQITDIRNQGDYYPETIEDALDYLTIIVKQLNDSVERSFQIGETYDEADVDTIASYIAQMNAILDDCETQVALAAAQVGLAEDQVTLAATQVGLAEDQVTLATAQANLAVTSAQSAAESAASVDLPTSPDSGDMLVYRTDEWVQIAEGTDGQVLTSTGTGTNPAWETPIGAIVQVVNTQIGAVATTTTEIPYDDSIPQSNEGLEVMTLAITPKKDTNKLLIEIVVNGSHSTNGKVIAALFQDSTVNALAAISSYDNGNHSETVTFSHYMVAGTTSEITFKVRAGANSTGTWTFNGEGGSRVLGGVMASSITITELKA